MNKTEERKTAYIRLMTFVATHLAGPAAAVFAAWRTRKISPFFAIPHRCVSHFAEIHSDNISPISPFHKFMHSHYFAECQVLIISSFSTGINGS